MAQIGIEFAERHQDESTLMQAWVRKDEIVSLQHLSADEQQVEVDAPVFTRRPGRRATHPLLDPL